jgi:hypothetical protein
MPVIRCRLAKDGRLIPTVVEFQPGETILFKSDQSVQLRGHRSNEVEAKSSFALHEIFADLESTGFQVDINRAASVVLSPPQPPPHITTIVLEPGEGLPAGTAGAAGVATAP